MPHPIKNWVPCCLTSLFLYTFADAIALTKTDKPLTSAHAVEQTVEDYHEYDDSITLTTEQATSVYKFESMQFHKGIEQSTIRNTDYLIEEIAHSNEISKNENSVIKVKVDRLSNSFKKSVEKIKAKHKRVDIIFLIDASSSVGKANFMSEIKFVKKLLSDFNVSYNYTRVAVVTFSSQKKIYRHIDQISQSVKDNDKCLLLNYQIPKILFSGGGTYTYGALKEAESIFKLARNDSKKIIFLITDGFSNGRDPVPLADVLKTNNVAIYSIGIQSGNYGELYKISSTPSEDHSYVLDSFNHFETLARKALHSDYRSGENIIVNSSLCNVLCSDDDKFLNDQKLSCCDRKATCSCSTSSGHYSCVCQPGFYGTGLQDDCKPCPNGTFWDDRTQCTNCPDANHITLVIPAMKTSDCVCKIGYKADESGRCEVITCRALTPPINGYFVKQPNACGQVLNAACGTRCQSGYQLVGDSIRLCQGNGSWSGNDPKCVLKTCPPLKIPYYGLAVCKNPDLNLYFDYSPRNKSFIANYSASVERLTEPMPIDTDCTIKCGHGFYLVGSSNRNCLPLSKWDGLHTSCKQILCPTLPKIPFGEYDPTDCADQKSAHGSNCTLICNFGFELKGGPSTKSCGGKRNGVWTQKTKTPRCVDVTPPHLMCPNNYTLPMHDDYNYAIIKQLNRPYVFDNGGDNFTFWAKPAIKEHGIKLHKGTHLFTYVAIDSFKNKAKCNFTVTIIDNSAPVFESCYDPPVYYLTATKNKNETFIEWDEPTVFDNSNESITVTRSMNFGYHDIGDYQVTYRARDSSDNIAECTLNVTVKESRCDDQPSPQNGQTICAKNTSHTWCEISCNNEHTFHDQDSSSIVLFCDNRNPKWLNDTILECSAIEKPTAVEEIITISLGPNAESLCDNDAKKTEIENMFLNNIKEHLCGNQEDCLITTSVPACDENSDENNKYQIVKREVNTINMDKPKRQHGKRDDKTTIKINVYTKLSKRLGLWKNDGKKSDNIKRIKTELQNINVNEKLRKRLGELNMDLSILKLDESIRCPNGSVAKKLICVQCPRGTFHNDSTNMCTSCPIGTYNELAGQTVCIFCPPYHSTRKPNSKHSSECKPQCPPGTVAKLKAMKREKNQKYHKSLMPFCRRCDPGEYQGLYNRISCDKCPPDHTSPRGSTSMTDCFPKRNWPCEMDPPVCGSQGQCVPEPINDDLYSCVCNEGFVGSHCEKALNVCATIPCHNSGSCISLNATSFECVCPKSYRGKYCEQFIDPCSLEFCQNGGTCIEIEGHSVCECLSNYGGDRCEIVKNYCLPNPCENGGTCHNEDTGYSCTCSPGQMGKRCHLKPCDYLPCPKNSICFDISQTNANKESFQCLCPKGLKGSNCTDIDDPCDQNPCKNNGYCIPVKLRDLTTELNQPTELNNDEIYTRVTCECPPYFYGSYCEVFTTPDFVMSFEMPGTNDYIKITGPNRNLSEISMCSWIQTHDDFNYGSVISYATLNIDNAFTFTDYSGFVLYIAGQYVVTNVFINDGKWHFICVSWTNQKGLYEIYLDGDLHTTGYNLSNEKVIEGDGLFIIGQEQDSLGGGFSESEAFVGKLAYLDVWSRALSGYEVRELYQSCEPYQGDIIKWTDLKSKIFGHIKLRTSEFCRMCEKNLTLLNGFVDYYENRAYLHCDNGYKLHGPHVVHCLRTSQWGDTSSFCKLIRCGALGSILNGKVIMSKTSFNGIARFVCDDGFYLSGSDESRCTIHGNWSNSLPECTSMVKCPALITSHEFSVTYASERGVFMEVLDSYAVGTLAEFTCADGFSLMGENLLTCLENGDWDMSMPDCISKKFESSSTETYSIPIVNRLEVPSIIKFNRRTDIRFWKQLRDYLFYGCKPIDETKRSIFCVDADQYSHELDDLTLFELPVSNEYQNMDNKLLERLEKTTKPDSNLKVYNLLNYILYGTIESISNQRRLPKETENSYRFVICLFIDIIMMDREVSFDEEVMLDINSRENTNAKVKSLLKNVVQPIYDTHIHKQEEERLRDIENQRNALKKIIALAEENTLTTSCRLQSLPDPPIDSRISAVTNTDLTHKITDLRIEKLRKRFESVPIGVFVMYECNAGFHMKGPGYVECLDGGQWSSIDSFCEGVLCEQAPVPPNMLIAERSKDSRHYYNDEIEFNCMEGYTMQGHPIIKCFADGQWSPVVARCTKISCGKPTISNSAKIIAGSSYLFGERLKILCEDRHTFETTCQANGIWHDIENC
ncbi:sushi, von Willebrand factor type A, EGF and pentraxin domain-containing protein 1-like isoform X2 [Malaya genurostris]|nr:sushi, von Willebrand factor type A, EGF and pentraxin domain-containing protein 1-like isoform X2 [Malaya genurostris]